MDIKLTPDGATLTIVLNGRLDTTTAPELEKTIKDSLGGITTLVFDMENLKYVSSAGLRVLLTTQKIMSKQGVMKLIKVNDAVMDIFEITGFSDILTIE